MIGWMQNWDTISFRRQEYKWFGQMSIPRELTVRNGRLYQRPIRELDALRQNKVEYHDVVVSDVLTLPGIEGRRVDMELVIRPENPDMYYRKFAVRFAQNEKYYTSLSFRPAESVLKIDPQVFRFQKSDHSSKTVPGKGKPCGTEAAHDSGSF